MLSAIIYGLRISIGVGVTSTLIALVIGMSVGLLAGYAGGRIEAADHAHRRHPAVVSRRSCSR